MWKHYLLSAFAAKPKPMAIVGGPQQYIDTGVEGFLDRRFHHWTAFTSLRDTTNGRVVLVAGTSGHDTFDRAILACPGDQAMDIV